MEGPIHSVIIKGNLKNNKGVISIKLPQSNLKYGLWQMRLKTLSFKANENINQCISIESNFVSDIQYSLSNEIEPFNSILLVTSLKANRDEFKVYHYDDSAWFVINNFNEIVEFIFRNQLSNENSFIIADIDIILHVLLRQIK